MVALLLAVPQEQDTKNHLNAQNGYFGSPKPSTASISVWRLWWTCVQVMEKILEQCFAVTQCRHKRLQFLIGTAVSDWASSGPCSYTLMLRVGSFHTHRKLVILPMLMLANFKQKEMACTGHGRRPYSLGGIAYTTTNGSCPSVPPGCCIVL